MQSHSHTVHSQYNIVYSESHLIPIPSVLNFRTVSLTPISSSLSPVTLIQIPYHFLIPKQSSLTHSYTTITFSVFILIPNNSSHVTLGQQLNGQEREELRIALTAAGREYHDTVIIRNMFT